MATSGRRLLLGALGSALVLVTGCKGGPVPALTPEPQPAVTQPAASATTAATQPSPSPAPSPTATLVASKPDAMGLLRASTQAMAGVRSWRSEMDLMVTLKAPPPLQPATPSAATPEEVSLFMDSDVSFVTGQGLTMDAKMRTAQAPDITFSMVVAGDEVFIRLGGEGWVLLDQATARQATSEGMLGRQSQPGLPFLTANVPWEAVKVEDLGDEKSDGVAVRRLVYDVDLKKVWAVMPADEKQKLADLYLPDELAPAAVEDLGQMMEVGKIEVWIDSSGFTRRMILEMVIRDVGTGQGTMAIYSDTRMSRFNEPQAIQRPSEFRRMDEVVTQQSSPGS